MFRIGNRTTEMFRQHAAIVNIYDSDKVDITAAVEKAMCCSIHLHHHAQHVGFTVCKFTLRLRNGSAKAQSK